jgi:hypothetical protein
VEEPADEGTLAVIDVAGNHNREWARFGFHRVFLCFLADHRLHIPQRTKLLHGIKILFILGTAGTFRPG